MIDGFVKSSQYLWVVIPDSVPEGTTSRRVKTGIQCFSPSRQAWIPACTGMTTLFRSYHE
jgi:hypothetical protein